MAYCTIMDVRRRIPEITADVVGDSDINDFIAEADGYINDALRNIYTVPFTTVPISIQNLSALWAAYITQTLYDDSAVEEDLDRMKGDIDSILGLYTSGKSSLGSEYEIEAPISENVYYTTRPSKYSYFEVDTA